MRVGPPRQRQFRVHSAVSKAWRVGWVFVPAGIPLKKMTTRTRAIDHTLILAHHAARTRLLRSLAARKAVRAMGLAIFAALIALAVSGRRVAAQALISANSLRQDTLSDRFIAAH